jgi:hypothetical protein
VKIISRRKKRETARQNLNEELQETKRKKLKVKTVTLLKKEYVNTPSTQKIHAKF